MEDKNKSFSWGNKNYSSFSTSNSFTNPFPDYYERRRFRYYDDYYTTGSSYRSERRSSMSSFMSSNYGFNSLSSIEDKEDDTKRIELFDKSVKLTREFISILNFPYPISIQVTNNIHETVISSDTRKLFLSTKVLDNVNARKENDIINIIVGHGLHEAAHLKYTNIKVLIDINDNAHLNFENRLLYLLVNILEDERVDRLLVLDRPGYSVFIDSAKEYTLSNFNYKKSIHTKEENTIINLIYLIRDQKSLDKDFILENEDLFVEINSVLNKFPTRTAEVIDTAKKLICILNSRLSSLSSTCSLVNKICNIFIPLLYGEDLTLNADIIYISDSDKYKSKYINLSDDFKIGIKESLGILKKYENNFYIVRDESSYDESLKREYNNIKKDILKFIPLIKNKLQTIEKNTKFNIPGCRSGLLDTEKLVEAYQNVPQVYTRVGTMTTNSVTVCIVVDESGSMSCSSRYKTARKAAILLYESLKELSGISLYIYGHTADQTVTGSVEVRPYIEPGTKNYLSLYNISARHENRDGDAILGIAKRIRSFTQDKCLMFVISDGQPCAYGYWDNAAITDSAEKIKRTKSLGFDIMQITISGDIRATKIMFGKNYIDLRHDLSELPEKLGKLIRDYIMKNKTTTITS